MRGFNGDDIERGIVDGQVVKQVVNEKGKYFAITDAGRYTIDENEANILFLVLSIPLPLPKTR